MFKLSIIAIKENLAVLTDDCRELLEKTPEDPDSLLLHKETNRNYINQCHYFHNQYLKC